MNFSFVPYFISIPIAICCAFCSEGTSLEMREKTCGDTFCMHSDNGPVCQIADGENHEDPIEGFPICQWSGSSCVSMMCGEGFPTCPDGTVCDSEAGASGSCIRSEILVADRTFCTSDSDCVPEQCCRPTMCVNRADRECRTYACCDCRNCEACISACRCVYGCCVTEYVDGCC